MSSTLRIRHILKGLVVTRLFSAWSRSYLFSSVVKRCRRDRGVRDVIQCFRQAFFRPKRTLLLYAAAAFQRREGERETKGPRGTSGCGKNISDAELQARVRDLERVEELSRATLYCPGCAMRVVLDKRMPGVRYCACSNSEPPKDSYQGWVPYMEAEDVIIWRKEYKPGQGLYAYKVYGRYKDIRAQDFAAIQVDGAYRRAWDNAVAALSVVERRANGMRDQAVLHWEVLWPRLFANRDYVYIRRHKEFTVKPSCLVHKEGIFNPNARCDEPATSEPHAQESGDAHKPAGDSHKPAGDSHKPAGDSHKPGTHKPEEYHERPNVHSNAKRKAMEQDLNNKDAAEDDKVYVIISRSCVHSAVPVTRHAIRVTEYWSNMVVRTVGGTGEAGMEFVLTYYDEPAVGGMPSAVASFATARGAPAFLARMRQAALDYEGWRRRNHQEAPDFMPFEPEKVSLEDLETADSPISEQDMESSKQGPDLENGQDTQEQGTQTDTDPPPALAKVVVEPLSLHQDHSVDSQTETPQKQPPHKMKEDSNKTPTETTTNTEGVNETHEAVSGTPDGLTKISEVLAKTPEKFKISDKAMEEEIEDAIVEEESEKMAEAEETKSGWYRYLYPFYYFV